MDLASSGTMQGELQLLAAERQSLPGARGWRGTPQKWATNNKSGYVSCTLNSCTCHDSAGTYFHWGNLPAHVAEAATSALQALRADGLQRGCVRINLRTEVLSWRDPHTVERSGHERARGVHLARA